MVEACSNMLKHVKTILGCWKHVTFGWFRWFGFLDCPGPHVITNHGQIWPIPSWDSKFMWNSLGCSTVGLKPPIREPTLFLRGLIDLHAGTAKQCLGFINKDWWLHYRFFPNEIWHLSAMILNRPAYSWFCLVVETNHWRKYHEIWLDTSWISRGSHS